MSSFIAPDRSLEVCILDKNMKVYQTNAGPLNLEETFRLTGAIGIPRPRIASGVIEWQRDDGETEDVECWMIYTWQEP